MSKLHIALLQILPGETREENLETGINACRKAKEMGADIALFPEMFSCGYRIPRSNDEQKRDSIPSDNAFVNAFGDLAKELDMAIAITYLEQWDPLPRNTLSLFDRRGKKVLTYAKVHTCVFGDECRLMAGTEFYTTDLETPAGTVRTGAMICFDREFPESARMLMLQGAELILVPNACPMEINRLSQLRGRAYENMTAIATCNYPAGQPDCNGHSTVFDGMAYLPDMEDSRDTCILEAGDAEGVFLATLDLDLLREYRRTEVHGNAYRRPELYGLLTRPKP
ncbi:MAG: carbon-nitrogen hydrolase family protein [Lachnospiraceae bacterium]